ncbi:transcription factor HIVEP3 [Melanotaenia boesemani]|uniref:transcription factor HIVEP3 n=1 Tax=Melanotaenia boesemani TaxID=1250792 RepID=UPI001C04BEE5|nr:transcription factor HIVEP3 [Melanotaenia boesemani]XP_041868150.1 transcription factor HIVEP3 [Melanotaenia boesemani]XP_041868152.1 transcription factor HIVEP3 [Melanotaenia boesemani]
MEALHNLTTGEQSGGQEHHQPESLQRGLNPKSPSQPHQLEQTSSPKPHDAPLQPKQPRKCNPERKRLRQQRQGIDSETVLEHKKEASAATKATATKEPSSTDVFTQAKPKAQEDNPKQKRERKPQRPGKYVCTYCGRPCAKPSVLQKHIRSHTGERPYPCAPCGFSFKTKSNLYKHRKSHTHRVKAGLALGEPKSLEEQVTESEDETRQLSSASSLTDRQSSVASMKSHETGRAKDCSGGSSDSYAVKKRLALRLSRGKHAPQDSSDEKTSSLILDSRGSTESGYFSRSESTEQSQDSPPNTSAKSYAEIILGKYGRLGHLQKMSRHHNQHPSGQEEKNISFTVPKKQVIDHITKLITINEAVVDTSKIDSVKPRRFSLSRKNSSESQKGSNTKEVLIHSPKAGDVGYKSTGSISMGVPCEKFHHPPVDVEQPVGQISTGPLVRSHSLPSAGSSFDVSGGSLCKFRLSQSFDERQPSEMQTSRRYGTLRRQPAIEIPLGADLTKEEQEVSHSFYPDSVSTDLTKPQPQPYECEACSIGCKDWEDYIKHKQSLCLAPLPQNEVVLSQMECSQLSNHAVRAGASTIRKRRKEESFEFDDPASPSLPFSAISSGQCKDENSVAHEGPRRPVLQTCSVIQHTSSFEKQESLCHENQSREASKSSPPHENYQLVSNKQPQHQLSKLPARTLLCQNNVKVPEILVTEDFSISPEASIEPASTTKNSEKLDEFQWPQRSQSLAQLPIEKLPPKKKRLRLAETAQSSGESSFESISLPHSPSQDSSASYASSRSTSFEEPYRPDMEVATSTPLRRSRAPHMLTVPGEHQHREMRRSASEQAPHDSQPSVLMAETRSKSFDYSCLSPERSAVGWRERRKCLLMRHAAIRDRDEEEEHCGSLGRSPEHVSPCRSSQSSPSSSPSPAGRLLVNTAGSQCKDNFSKWKLSQNIQLIDAVTHDPSIGVKKEALYIHSPQPNPTYGPSGAARAHYLPMSTGLKLEIPSRCDNYTEGHIQHSVPHITSSLEILTPLTSPTVAVRLQTDTLTPACAIYTTLSQSTSPRPQEALDAVSPNMGMSTAEYRNRRNMSPDLQPWFDDGLRSPGSGGNKRMLSPSNSMELHPESQQQQKRVKEEEEEEKEAGCPDTSTVDTLKQENQPCFPVVGSPISLVETSFPSLLSSTCNSWCYLNYIKPNPSALDEQKPSVYSSWSTSSYDPNPPGLSSKTVLSLLHCKQRLSPSIYTTSPMSVRTTQSVEQEDSKRPCSSKVYNSLPYSRDQEGVGKGPLPADDNGPDTIQEKEEKKKQEEVRSFSRKKQSPERRSNTPQDAAHEEDEKDCQCEDLRFHCKNASELSSESSPCNCNHCKSTVKAAGRSVEHLRSEVPENQTSCHSEDTHEGVFEDQSFRPDQHDDSQSSAVGKGLVEEDDHGQDEDSRSTVAVSDEAHPGSSLPVPATSTQKSSAGARRALFARRRHNASESPSTGDPPSPGSGREPSTPSDPSSRPHQSPAPPLILSTCQVSADSPVPGLSSAPGGCQAGVSAQCPPCPHLTDQMSAARPLVHGLALTHIAQQPSRSRGSSNLLSHLPLHSQQPSRAPSLLIPIGGIHMIQPRSPLPLYRLVSSPSASRGKGRLAVPPLQDALREASPSPKTAEQIPAGDPSPGQSRERFSAWQQSGPETKHPDPPVIERHVYMETTQSHKKAPSPQTQL